MDSPSPSALHPALLSPGAVVGNCRVEAWAGCGVFGAVYRALPLHDAHASPVALKLALHPEDPRFAREGELLSRCHHPSIPRLLDQGSWRSPLGTLHPFVVMQWVEGVSLYEQAHLQLPHPPQVRLWLAQLAQALAVIHAQGAVHRDLKGGNIQIRSSDGRAMLMDFGTGIYPGAAPVTPPMGFPGTHVYRSPQSWLFEVQYYCSPTALYRSSPADDLYALGVTACRLLTGRYPEIAGPSRDEHNILRLEGVRFPPALLRNPHVDPALRAVILRLLSEQPEQRGTAAQLAEELEHSLRHFRPSSSTDSTKPSKTRALWRHAKRWGLLAAATLALTVGVSWAVLGKPLQERSIARAERSDSKSAKAGTAGLGDAATAPMMEKASLVSTEESISDETPPEPLPGQARPDEKGRCPRKDLVPLNGGCWKETTWEPEACVGLGQMFRRTCYVPFIPPKGKRPPTSSPMKKQ